MSSATIQSALLWCAVLNYGLLILWWIIFQLPHKWIYNFSTRTLRVTEEQFDAYNLVGIIFYKMAIILFCLVPYIALRLVG